MWDFATKSQRHKIFLPRITQINANKLFSSACLISTNWNPPLPVRNFNCNRQSGRPAVKTDSLGRAKGAETQRILLLRQEDTKYFFCLRVLVSLSFYAFSSQWRPLISMAMAPRGAVTTILRTATARIISAPAEWVSASGTAPMAACTVAFGI